MIRIYIVAILFTALILGSFGLTGSAYSKDGKDCNARCWYVKYRAEKRKVGRIEKSNRALRRVVSGKDRLVQEVLPWVALGPGCETRGLRQPWRANTGNGFLGGLQFNLGTWRAYGGETFAKLPHRATPMQQVAIAQKVKASQGKGAWPNCGRYL